MIALQFLKAEKMITKDEYKQITEGKLDKRTVLNDVETKLIVGDKYGATSSMITQGRPFMLWKNLVEGANYYTQRHQMGGTIRDTKVDKKTREVHILTSKNKYTFKLL